MDKHIISFFWGVNLVKITYFGSEKNIAKAIAIIKRNTTIMRIPETEARLKIQQLLDQYKLRATILVNDNPVWSKKRIIRNVLRINKIGTLYNAKNQSKPPILSQYFYQFLYLECGSVAHYDIYGWTHKYPTILHLRKFFKSNEFGEQVSDFVSTHGADVINIVAAIENLLCPFQVFMKANSSQAES